MRRVLPFLILAPMATAQPITAQSITAQSITAQPMSPADFQAFATGRTLDYAVDGSVRGTETYLPDRKVRDADIGGPCRTGRWYPDGPAVCFVYDGSDRRHCWLYWREGDQVLAKPLRAGPDAPSQTVTPAAAPLSCDSPKVGV